MRQRRRHEWLQLLGQSTITSSQSLEWCWRGGERGEGGGEERGREGGGRGN